VRAVEDLVGTVRDDRSRRYLAEAGHAYQAGALRPAIIATWVAVALDLVAKIRQLADDGDGAARVFVSSLDGAIASGSASALQTIEQGILTTARDQFEMISAREFTELERLHQDRHVYAHPAFVAPDEVFVPSAELVRAHLAVAVEAVLSKPPTPGKKALERFQAEVAGNAFPDDLDELTRYLRDRYLQPGRTSLRTNLAILIVKGCLQPPDGDRRIARRCSLAAHALDRIEPALLAEALTRVITRREEGAGLSDAELLGLVGALGDLTPVWTALPVSSHPKVHNLLRRAAINEMAEAGVFGRSLPDPIASIVADRIADAGLDRDTVATLIEATRAPSLIPRAIKFLCASVGYRAAEANMAQLVLPVMQFLDADQLRQILRCVRSNNQLHYAAAMPSLLINLFQETRALWNDCAPDWRDLCTFFQTLSPDDPEGHYAYPELRQLVISAGA
jgi:hypothetical protein